MEPLSNLKALERFMNGINEPDPALTALARTLASTLDDGAGLATAAVSKEYRATLAALKAPGDPDSDILAGWLADLSAPLVEPPV